MLKWSAIYGVGCYERNLMLKWSTIYGAGELMQEECSLWRGVL
jgi:hypothetical protein